MAIETGLAGRTVLITGAGRNIGRLAALAFAREGAHLALCTRTSLDSLEAVAREARALGARALVGRCDVSDSVAVSAFVARVRDEFGAVDVAVNNAVYRSADERKGFLEEPDDAWRRNFAVNLEGPRNVCRAILPLMKERQWGRIVNFSGATGYLGAGVGRAAVRMGVVGLTRGIAREFGAFNITANCIGPSTVATERDTATPRKGVRDTQPIRRLAQPEEIAALVVYLASDNAGFITGQSYLVNGGSYFL